MVTNMGSYLSCDMRTLPVISTTSECEQNAVSAMWAPWTRSAHAVRAPWQLDARSVFSTFLQDRACNLTLFETTRITSETILKTTSLKHAFWRYLKRFGTFYTHFFKAYALKVFETIWNCREKNENNVSSLNVFFYPYKHKTNNLSYNI